MTSAPVRDPLADHLLTPENAAFLFIDYQPAQLAAVRSMPASSRKESALARDQGGYGRELGATVVTASPKAA